MSSDDEEYEVEKFQCAHIITVIYRDRIIIFLLLFLNKKEDHKQTIYGISICQQSIPGENEEAFLFATCSINQVGIIFHFNI
jgi:hypothetical protein